MDPQLCVTDSSTEIDGDVVVVGAGGHGREVVDVAVAAGLQVRGVVDDGPVDIDVLHRRNLQFLGPVDQVKARRLRYLIGIGSGAVRRKINDRLRSDVEAAASAVHPTASMGADVRSGRGLVLCAHSSVTTNVDMGVHCHLNRGATIGHDCTIGAFVTLNPGAIVSGNVVLGGGVTVGSGAVVIQGVSIGSETMVGAGAVVTRDLPAGVVAYGNPARVMRELRADERF